MASLDGNYNPFNKYPGYSMMAPCMRSCEGDLPYNGCDNSGCWCKKNNLDRRISQYERCASTSCTFADMNTATDVEILSGIQLQYCVDRGQSPEGMTMPSTVEAQTTDSSSSPSETGGVLSTGFESSEIASSTRSRPSSGPSSTGDPAALDTNSPPLETPSSSSGLTTAAKAGIAIGAVFCALLAILIAILLLRRRKSRTTQYAAPQGPYPPPPPMTSTAYPTTGPSAPPPIQQSTPLHVHTAAAGSKGDVSPIEEKSAAFVVTRKEVGGDATPALSIAAPAPATEVHGSAVPERHEVHGEERWGQVQEEGGQGRWVYEVNGGTGQGAYELGGGR